jgi:hypothetical protein
MTMLKALGVLVVGLALGCWIGMRQRPAQTSMVNDERLRAFVDQDLRRYADATTVEEKLRAADELYGKAVLLFLADLGLHVKGLPVSAPKVIATPQVAAKLDEIALPEEKEFAPKFEMGEAHLGDGNTLEKTKKDAPPPLPSPKGDRLNNLMSYQRSPVSERLTPEVRKLNGHFEGSFHIESGKGKGRVDSISMTVEVAMAPKLSGDIHVKIAKPDGTVWSNGFNNGTVRSLREVPGKKGFIYVEPAPGDFILLDVRRDNSLSGDYFDNDGTYLGRVQLRRR